MGLVEQLIEIVDPVLENFKGDLAHDRSWIEQNPGAAFVHVTRRNGTHIFGLPKVERLVREEEEPYLFGTATPSYIYHDTLKALRHGLLNDGKLWLVFDGKKLTKRTGEQCIALYERTLAAAERQAKRERRAA